MSLRLCFSEVSCYSRSTLAELPGRCSRRRGVGEEEEEEVSSTGIKTPPGKSSQKRTIMFSENLEAVYMYI